MIGLAVALALQAAQAPLPEVITRARVNRDRGVDFHALVVPETVYVGQQATYQLGVFLDQDTRQRIRRNPEFQPPETRSLLSYDLRERGPGSLSGTIDGRPYEMHVFRRALFPLTPGRYAIPPARLTYSLPQTASFFSREENFSLRSEGVALIVINPPSAERPADWAGAVGAWRAVARVDTVRGRAGDPFVLTLRIEGQGNVTLLPRPHIAMAWAGVVNADERVRVDSAPSLLGGWKEFDWLVTPRAAGTQRVPALRYAYFNPRTRRYEVASTAPFDVSVAAGDVADTPDASDAVPVEVASAPPLRASLGEETPLPLGASPMALALIAVGPLAAFFAWFTRRPRRVRPPLTPRQQLDRIAPADDAGTVREVRRLLVEGITRGTRLRAEHLTERGAWTMALRKEGLSPGSATAIELLLNELDGACFARTPPAQPRGASWAAQVREALDLLDEEGIGSTRRRRGRRPVAAASAAIVAMAVGGTLASAQGDAGDSFARGATAYAGADYVRAARHFEDAARQAPRSIAAWMNLGTSAIMAHDTATAVVGWQRALRLDPTDEEPRVRLAQLRTPQESGYARVWPVPARLATGAALLLWLAGWAFTARQSLRRHSAWRLGVMTTVVGGAALALAYRIEERLEGRRLVVVTNAAPLRALPSLGAESRSTPMPGEVAAVVERHGVWVHLRLDGARDGWIPAERVAPLGRD